MQHQPIPALDSNTNPLPQAPQLQNFLLFHSANRRFHSPQQERANDPHMFQLCAQNPLSQRLSINRDVRTFRHVSLADFFCSKSCSAITIPWTTLPGTTASKKRGVAE